MRWQQSRVAPDQTHHLLDAVPMYVARYTEVLSFHEPGLASARDISGAFHIRTDGMPAYRQRFSRTFGFYEGRAAVVDGSGAHHIDEHGEDIGPHRFAWCGNFQGSACTVRDIEGRYFHISRDGEQLYGERWSYAGDFREGAAVVLAANGLHHHIDSQGRSLGTGEFLDLDVFHKGYARARDERGWFHVRRDGSPAYPARFSSVEPFYNGQARCEAAQGELVVVDESGRLLTCCRRQP